MSEREREKEKSIFKKKNFFQIKKKQNMRKKLVLNAFI